MTQVMTKKLNEGDVEGVAITATKDSQNGSFNVATCRFSVPLFALDGTSLRDIFWIREFELGQKDMDNK